MPFAHHRNVTWDLLACLSLPQQFCWHCPTEHWPKLQSGSVTGISVGHNTDQNFSVSEYWPEFQWVRALTRISVGQSTDWNFSGSEPWLEFQWVRALTRISVSQSTDWNFSGSEHWPEFQWVRALTRISVGQSTDWNLIVDKSTDQSYLWIWALTWISVQTRALEGISVLITALTNVEQSTNQNFTVGN